MSDRSILGHGVVGSSDRRVMGSSDRSIVGHGVMGSSGHRVMGSWGHRVVGSWGRGVIGRSWVMGHGVGLEPSVMEFPRIHLVSFRKTRFTELRFLIDNFLKNFYREPSDELKKS